MQLQNQKDEFTHDLEIPAEYESLVQACFKIKPLRASLDDPTDPLEYNIKFEPLKPFKTSVDFNILRKSGGRWK